jgi:hypothetical protein
VRRLAFVGALAAGAAASLSIGACITQPEDPPPSCSSPVPIVAGRYGPLHVLPDGGAVGDDYQLTISADLSTVEQRFVRGGRSYVLRYAATGTIYGTF